MQLVYLTDQTWENTNSALANISRSLPEGIVQFFGRATGARGLTAKIPASDFPATVQSIV